MMLLWLRLRMRLRLWLQLRLLLNLVVMLMMMVQVWMLIVVLKNHVALVWRRIHLLLRMAGDVALLCGFWLSGCRSRWSDGVRVYVALRCSRLLLKCNV